MSRVINGLYHVFSIAQLIVCAGKKSVHSCIVFTISTTAGEVGGVIVSYDDNMMTSFFRAVIHGTIVQSRSYFVVVWVL